MDAWNSLLKYFVEQDTKTIPCDHYIYQTVPTPVRNVFNWFLDNCQSRDTYVTAGQGLTFMEYLLKELQNNVSRFANEDYYALLNVLSDFQVFDRLTIFTALQAGLLELETLSLNSEKYKAILGIFKFLEDNWKQRDTFLTSLHPQGQVMDSIIKELESSVNPISGLLSSYSQVIKTWKFKARFQARNPEKYSVLVKHIKSACQDFPKIITQSIAQIERIKLIFSEMTVYTEEIANRLTNLKNLFGNLLRDQLMLAFTIEQHPPEVVNIEQKFDVSVSFLLDSEIKTIGDPGELLAYLLNEKMANDIYDGKLERLIGEAKISPFDNIKVNKKNVNLFSKTLFFKTRPEGKTSEAKDKELKKGEEKVAILFTYNLLVLGFRFTIWTMSLPLAIATHFSQKPLAFATIFWDREFSDMNRKSFKVCESVKWTQLEKMLTRYFDFHAGTTRSISLEEMAMLKRKLLGNVQSEDVTVSRSKLCYEPMDGSNFSFWSWYYHIVKMISGPLKKLWADECIKGFIDREEANIKLENCKAKTFLMRFSFVELEAISIHWRSKDGKVYTISPTIVATKTASQLAMKVADIDQLEYLYPKYTPKKKVFSDCKTTGLAAQFYKLCYVTLKLVVDIDSKQSKIVHCQCCKYASQDGEHNSAENTNQFNVWNENMDTSEF